MGLQRRGPAEDIRAADAVGGEHIYDGGMVAGQGTGLIECQMPDATEALKGGAGLDDHAELTGRPDGRDHRDRHRNRQRTRRRGDQDNQGTFDPHTRIPEQGPDHGDQDGEDEDTGHQGAGEAIGDTGALALIVLGLLHQLDDGGQGVIRAGGGGLNLQCPGGVDRPGQHCIAGADLDGDRFAGDRRSVQAAVPGADNPVGGQAFPRGQAQHVTRDEVFDRHGAGRPMGGDDRRGRGDQGQQGTQARAGLVHRLILQRLGDGVEEGQGGGLLDEAQQDGTDGADRHQQPDTQLAPGDQSREGSGDELGGTQQQGGPEQYGGHQPGPGDKPLEDQADEQEHSGSHRDKDGTVTPPRGVLLVFCGRCGRFTPACGRHDCWPLSSSQQPATGHCGSRHAAFSSTARVVSTRTASARAR